MLEALTTLCRENWASWIGTGVTPAHYSFTILARPAITPQRGTVLVLADGDTAPRVCLKVGLSPLLREPYHREGRILRTLPKELPSIVGHVPECYGVYEMPKASVVLASSVMDGDRIREHVRTRRGLTMEPAVTLLRDAAGITTHHGEGSAVIDMKSLTRDIEWALDCGRLDGRQEQRVLHESQAELLGLTSHVHGCWQHGDLVAGNVLRGREGPLLIDWELANDSYPPWFDLCYATATLSLAALRPRSRTSPSDVIHELAGHGWSHPVSPRAAILQTACSAARRAQVQNRGSGSYWFRAIELLANATYPEVPSRA